jgi:hypothetical protein
MPEVVRGGYPPKAGSGGLGLARHWCGGEGVDRRQQIALNKKCSQEVVLGPFLISVKFQKLGKQEKQRMRSFARTLAVVALLTLAASAQSITGCRLSSNSYDPNSTSNPYSRCGSPYSSDSINNPYGRYGSPYSPYSVTNPYANEAPTITSSDGTYLGRYSSNRYAPDSTSNPYGAYGNRFASDSINNPYGPYGSPYSSQSANNPYSIDAPTLSDSQ